MRTTLRRRPPALGAILLVSLSLAACGSSGTSHTTSATTAAASNATDTSSVTLRVGDQAGTGAHALLTAAGLLDKLPFKVSWSDFTSGPPILQAINSGALDIGGVGDAPPVFAAAGGAKIAIVGALHNNPDSAALLVPRDSPIHSLADLKGKKIAVAQGSSADFHILSVLSKAGLSVHDVSLDYMQPAEGLAALASGSVDAWDIWQPFIQQAVAEHGARIIVNGRGYGGDYSFTVASRAALGDPAKAAAIRQYLALLNRAHVWADAHVQAWSRVWSKATGLPASVMLTAATDNTQTPVAITPPIVASEQGVVDAFYGAGLIPKKVNFADYSYSGFNGAVGGG